MNVYIDKYQYVGDDGVSPKHRSPQMDTNIAAWMVSGGPHVQTRAQAREREQLYAFRESQLVEKIGRPSLVARIRSLITPTPAEPELACCPA